MAATRSTRAAIVRRGGAALGVAMLAACGQSNDAPAVTAPKREITLTHWAGMAATGVPYMAHKATLDAQAAQMLTQLGIRVNLEFANTEKVIAATAGGTPPATAMTPYWDGAGLFGPGMTADLDEELKKVKEWPALRKDLFPGILESQLWQGKLTAMPLYTNNRIVFVDRSVLAKAGLSAPSATWTRDEFTQLAMRASAPPERWGFAFTAQALDFLIFFGAAGGKMMNADHTKWQVDGDLGRETLRYLHDLSYGRQISPAPPPGEMMRTGEGKVAFDMTVNERYSTMRQVKVDVGAAPIPNHRARFTMGHGWSASVLKNKDGDAQNVAARFLMWLNSPQFQVPNIIGAEALPVSKGALEHKDYQAKIAQDAVTKVFADQMPFAYRVPTFPTARKSEFELEAYLKKAFENQIGLNEALVEGQRAAQVVLDADLKASRV
jgi:ABC-type glycerol-3-phosphate transport system substrate-binding protein